MGQLPRSRVGLWIVMSAGTLSACAPAFVDSEHLMPSVLYCSRLPDSEARYCDECFKGHGVYRWHSANLFMGERWSCENFFSYPDTCLYITDESARADCLRCTQVRDYYRSGQKRCQESGLMRRPAAYY
jgi:hypothetical protein